MRDGSSTGTADDSALLQGSKKLDELRNGLESNKEAMQVDCMKKVIGYIAKGTCHTRAKIITTFCQISDERKVDKLRENLEIGNCGIFC